MSARKNNRPENKDLDAVTDKYAFAVTDTISKQIAKTNCGALKKQFLPDIKELDYGPNENPDPIGDLEHTKVKGLVHRYPDRCLLKPINICAVYCRFCFRREKIGPGQKALSEEELNQCFDYIKNNKNIWEVILTGGDPLILPPEKLKSIIENLNKIEHVKIIRLHTRIPVVDPKRINDDLLSVLKLTKPIYILLHVNHINEFTEKSIEVISKIVDSGVVLLSQTVLLKGINNNLKTLSELFKKCVELRIKPYYLHHLDFAPGTSHFRTTIKEGQEIIKQLQGSFSGLCQPTYVVDIPGGFGKVPIGPQYLKKEQENYCLCDYKGKWRSYTLT